MKYSGSGEEEEEEPKENIYEEIKEKSEEQHKSPLDSKKLLTTSQEMSTTSSTKSRFQKALEAVTRRSSRSLEHGEQERSFPLSISKGRKKTLIDRAKVDWDNETEEVRQGRGGRFVIYLEPIPACPGNAEPPDETQQPPAGPGGLLPLQGAQPAQHGR